jgi:hypothetical protein
MSLAMFAAPFNDNNDESLNNDQDNSPINKKRRTHSRTQKIYPKENIDKNKVNSVLSQIHNTDDDDDDGSGYKLPPNPQSAGAQKTQPLNQKEQMMNMSTNSDGIFRTLGRAPQPNYEGSDNLDLNDYSNYGNEKTNEEYYKRTVPGYVPEKSVTNRPYYNTANYTMPAEAPSQDVLLQKLNYMISLLEDQQDERTNNVTEEVVLYSFLGIFIIFIADTFVRAGKYVR